MADPTLKYEKSMRWTQDVWAEAFQPCARRMPLVPAVWQSATVAHEACMPTVCSHVPDQLPIKLSIGQTAPAAQAIEAIKTSALRYIVEFAHATRMSETI
jgi:hypothetical protein